MRSLKSNSFNLSRRRMLATAAAAAATFPSAAKAGWNLKQEPSIAKLVEALRFIGKPVCVTAADSLATSTDLRPGFDLHLRNANLHDKDAQVLATGLRHLDADRDTPLQSFSVSYNPGLGDAGATILAHAFPASMTELGMVGCSIGDTGGRAILHWAQSAPNLQMVCVEGNNFSAELKSQFKKLAAADRSMLVVT